MVTTISEWRAATLAFWSRATNLTRSEKDHIRRLARPAAFSRSPSPFQRNHQPVYCQSFIISRAFASTSHAITCKSSARWRAAYCSLKTKKLLGEHTEIWNPVLVAIKRPYNFRLYDSSLPSFLLARSLDYSTRNNVPADHYAMGVTSSLFAIKTRVSLHSLPMVKVEINLILFLHLYSSIFIRSFYSDTISTWFPRTFQFSCNLLLFDSACSEVRANLFSINQDSFHGVHWKFVWITVTQWVRLRFSATEFRTGWLKPEESTDNYESPSRGARQLRQTALWDLIYRSMVDFYRCVLQIVAPSSLYLKFQ